MPVKLTSASEKRLIGVHPHLVSVVRRAAEITDIPFQITCGPRSLSEQKRLVKIGASRTLRSRHIPAPNGLAHAIDFVAMPGGKISWAEPLYHRIADAFKRAARELGITIEWGGDWRGFFDGPHVQLPWAQYPGIKAVGETPPPPPDDIELMTLVPGARGDRVKALQETLNIFGAGLTVDGDFGPKTRAALIAATGIHLKKATDIVTGLVMAKLLKAATLVKKAAEKRPVGGAP